MSYRARISFILGSLCSFALISTTVSADVVGIGTTKGGANATVGAAIAKVVSDTAGFQMRPQKMGGTQQYIPVVNNGELEFGLSNVMQYGMAVDGSGMSAGSANPNLRLVATLMKFRNGVLVGRESGINTLADLKGKRVPTGYTSAPLFEVFKNAFLSSAGLTDKDVTPVPVAGLPQSWDAFKKGQVDMTIIAAGAGPIKEMETAISGGVKFIPLVDTPAARADLPRTEFMVVEPAPAFVAIREPTMVNVYEYVLFTHANVDDEVVYKVAKAILDQEEDLRATSPLWKAYSPKDIGKNYDGLAYHPGALKLFKEKGLTN